MKRTLLYWLCGAMLAGVPLYAHHSFAVDYFETQTVSVEGELLQFQHKNPHSIVVIAVTDERGQVQTYTGEWGGMNRLNRDGVTPQTLKPGDHIIVNGSPGRTPGEPKLHLKGIFRPADGWRWGRAS